MKFNFSETGAIFCLSLHYNGDNSYLFINGKEIIKFKAKDSEIVEDPVCLGKAALYGSVYYFSVDHNAIAFDDILDIRNYLYKKYVI